MALSVSLPNPPLGPCRKKRGAIVRVHLSSRNWERTVQWKQHRKAGEQSLLEGGEGASQLQQNPALLESRECL